MVSEVTALEFKLDTYALPLAFFDLTLRFAIRVTRLNSLDEIAKLSSNHPKQEHNALLIHWFVS